MRYVRFIKNGKIGYGLLEGEGIEVLERNFLDGIFETDEKVRLEDVRLLSPVSPGKALCIGLNYREHIGELEMDRPEKPVVFIKPTTALLNPGEHIIRPEMSKRVDYEAELCVVIGRKAKDVKIEDAYSYVLGYTIANDVTARDLQEKGGQWTICKGFDTFMPIGPYISDEVNPCNLHIQSRLNGKVMQDADTSLLIFKIDYLISYLSSVMTLEKGDVILTGTPKGVSPMAKGDVIECEIKGLGILKNTML